MLFEYLSEIILVCKAAHMRYLSYTVPGLIKKLFCKLDPFAVYIFERAHAVFRLEQTAQMFRRYAENVRKTF